MGLVLTVSAALMLFSLLNMCSLSMLDLIPYVNSISLEKDTSIGAYYHYPDRSTIDQAKIDNTLVEIVKSFKNSSGFYKINGTLENHGAIILSDIHIIKYYKVPSVNGTTLVCYEQTIVDCEYKPVDNQLPSKKFFSTIPPEPESDSNIEYN
ncbi:hypothetical protein [Candidatus Nitrosocosmicus hydrocola]|uniref:hypothetical protein n=1 Tax=Candidatus Nitrosocosmicus hydrocola TaxID=1826872 RepID=UPI0011E5C0BF|nr:hypothetical protein [Candidatus Nitrosocosmicus hydrocola]